MSSPRPPIAPLKPSGARNPSPHTHLLLTADVPCSAAGARAATCLPSAQLASQALICTVMPLLVNACVILTTSHKTAQQHSDLGPPQEEQGQPTWCVRLAVEPRRRLLQRACRLAGCLLPPNDGVSCLLPPVAPLRRPARGRQHAARHRSKQAAPGWLPNSALAGRVLTTERASRQQQNNKRQTKAGNAHRDTQLRCRTSPASWAGPGSGRGG